MRNLSLVFGASLIVLALSGCGSQNGNQSSVAAVPQACGTGGIPTANCTAYNPLTTTTGYCNGTIPLTTTTPSTVPVPGSPGYGWGANQPCTPNGINQGCPFGMQAIAIGGPGYGTQNYGGNGFGYGYNNGYNNGSFGGSYETQTFTCVQTSYLVNQYSGYTPYYPSNYNWGGGTYGYGPAQGCDPYRGAYQCGGGGNSNFCRPPFDGSRFGICVVGGFSF